MKEWTDIKGLDAQLRTIEKPTKDYDRYVIEIGLFESLGEVGGMIITESFKAMPTMEEIEDLIIEWYQQIEHDIETEATIGVVALSDVEEKQLEAIQKNKSG